MFFIVKQDSPWGGYTAAHELWHLLTNDQHLTNLVWRITNGKTLWDSDPTDSKRFTPDEEQKIKENKKHVK